MGIFKVENFDLKQAGRKPGWSKILTTDSLINIHQPRHQPSPKEAAGTPEWQ